MVIWGLIIPFLEPKVGVKKRASCLRKMALACGFHIFGHTYIIIVHNIIYIIIISIIIIQYYIFKIVYITIFVIIYIYIILFIIRIYI